MGHIGEVKDLLAIAKDVSEKIKGEKSDSLEIDCMNNLGKYFSTINIDNKFTKFFNKGKVVSFPSESVYSARVFALKPVPVQLHDSVSKTPDAISIDFSKCLECDLIRLEVNYRMKEETISGLVKYRSSPEPLEKAMVYHLSAQLRDPAGLIQGFSEVEVGEFPVTASIYIQENLDTPYPILNTVRKLKDLERQILAIEDPRASVKIAGLQKQRTALMKKVKREAPEKLLKELVALVGPNKFIRYIKTEEDFRIHKCEWAEMDSLMNLCNITLPKEIEVVTRTDLSLKKPASKGHLVYDSGKFTEDLEEMTKN